MNPYSFKGLNNEEVVNSKQLYGSNTIEKKEHNAILEVLKDTLTEPMFLLLLSCIVIYFLLGELSEAWFMLGALLLVSAISFLQENRSRKALDTLKGYTQAHTTVIRNNEVLSILSEEIVVGDFVVVSEGELIPADGIIKQLNDFSVNESILTGESFAVAKDSIQEELNKIFHGTLVVSGQAILEVTAIAGKTRLAKIGSSLDDIVVEKTPLQKQINSFVTWMAVAGAIIFSLIWGYSYYLSGEVLASLLKGLTIAMSVLPEEIPVAFATFMALGSWRLMKLGVIVKQTQTVEALGSATVLCTDKTGTITENKMELQSIYLFTSKEVLHANGWNNIEAKKLIEYSMWASESVPFDPMEQAIHKAYVLTTAVDIRSDYSMVHEYPLEGHPPMMTHIFESSSGNRIIACKGAPEAILKYSSLNEIEVADVEKQLKEFASKGLRVLAVATTTFDGNDFPKSQEEFKFEFLGLIGFIDPPKANISKVFEQLYQAGIEVKIITGDNPITTAAIAKEVDFKNRESIISSVDLVKLDEKSFDLAVQENYIFTRIFPELKLRIIQSLKKQNYIVGMTGDGVNDGPALKAANIGIAMGMRGSEIAKEASTLILTDDDFGKMVDAVAMGRKIYANLKKAIQYIISIHIPIILTVAAPLLLGWVYPEIFTPVHVIFLELIMGPTCSIVYENEPLEKNSMLMPPRHMRKTFLKFTELFISIVQGLGITVGTLGVYQYCVSIGCDEQSTRTMVFATLVFANICLTLVNRSFYYSVFTTLYYKNNMMKWVVFATVVLLGLLIYVPFIANFFELAPLSLIELFYAMSIAFVSVCWFELYKGWKRWKFTIG
jgi:P-type Ca2+ transporter type 2C